MVIVAIFDNNLQVLPAMLAYLGKIFHEKVFTAN